MKIELRSEIDTLFETFEKISKEDTLKIFVFYSPQQYPQIYNQATQMLLYGTCEIRLDKLLPNNGRGSNWTHPLKTLAGWYSVQDPDDPRMNVGQLKVKMAEK